MVIFFFKQKTAYEIKECDWSSDVCSSDLDLTRGTLTNLNVNTGRAFAVVGAWDVFGLIATYFLVRRRK